MARSAHMKNRVENVLRYLLPSVGTILFAALVIAAACWPVYRHTHALWNRKTVGRWFTGTGPRLSSGESERLN